ncbi:MAG: hypothetical protein PHQ28_13300 [Mycobacterium sp.]|nr:hypothetical protein [Mycobacterium sp.]
MWDIIREAERCMAGHGAGSIVNVAPIGGLQAGRGVMTSLASKAAPIHFSGSLVPELDLSVKRASA